MTSTSSTTDRTAPPDRVLVGILVRPHGVRGEAVVAPRSERAERFAPGSELWLVTPNGAATRVRLATSRPYRDGWLVTFDGISERERLESLRGAALEVGRDEVDSPPDGRFWLFDLVGCRCHDRSEGELGEVVDVVEDGGGWLIVVARAGGGHLALPFVETFLVAIDMAAKRLDWELPVGLIESCESRS